MTKSKKNVKSTEQPPLERTADAMLRFFSTEGQKSLPLESSLGSIFGHKALQLPKAMQDVLAAIAPWLALFVSVWSVYFMQYLWSVRWAYQSLTPYDTSYYMNWVNNTAIGALGVLFFLGLLAFYGLRAKQKAGWNLVFVVMTLSVILGILTPVIGVTIGEHYVFPTESFIRLLVASLVSYYFLFQIRPYYK